MTSPPSSDDFVPVADIEIDSVQPARSGFVLTGRGDDRAEYRLEMQMDMPVDQRTRAVLGEILSQSEWRLWRRAPRSLRREAQRPRKPVS
jgi:hypothetical protein